MLGASESSARRIRNAVRAVEALPPANNSNHRRSGNQTAWVKLTSTTATSSRYPGTRFDRNIETQAWDTTSETVWLEVPNGETVDTSTYYPCRFQGILAADGVSVYMRMYGGSAVRTGFTPVRVVAYTLAAYTRSGNVITASANGALANIDSLTMVVGDRILFVKNYMDDKYADNGIYEVTDLGSAGTPFILTRTSDASTSADFVNGYTVSSQWSTNNAGSEWVLMNHPGDLPVNLNTTSIHFLPRIFPIKESILDYYTATLPAFTASSDWQTLTGTANGALGTIDGHTMALNETLLYGPTSDSNYAGLYYVSQVGDAGTPYKVTRKNEANILPKMPAGITVRITSGTTYAGSVWRQRHDLAAFPFFGNATRWDQIA